MVDKLFNNFLSISLSFPVILKDVSFNIMMELLEFMYQGANDSDSGMI